MFGIALGMDSFARGFGIMQENTPIRRDRQIKVDIFMDFSTVAVPLVGNMVWLRCTNIDIGHGTNYLDSCN